MRILVVSETYPPEINGVARTLAQIVDGMAALGHTVTVVKPSQPSTTAPITDEPTRVAFHAVRGMPLPGYPDLQFGSPALSLLKRLFNQQIINVAYIATEGPLGYAALHACRRAGVPIIAGMHTNFDQYSRHYHAHLLAPLAFAYLRHFHNRVDTTLVPTACMADEMRAKGVRRLEVWPRGVHADLFDPQRRSKSLRARWGVSDNDLAVLYVGRVAAEKSVDEAFDAFDAIHARHPSARMIVVGSGPLEARLRAARPDTVFCGMQTGAALASHYASGDLFLFPSKTETFGNVTLEAMASGLAVVAYDLAAAHALIRDGENGLLAAADERQAFIAQAVRCADDAALRAQLKRHARATALQQAWPTLLGKLESLFQAACAKAGNGRFQKRSRSTQ